MDCVCFQSGRCDLHKGLWIEISEHPHSMRQVANIIVALHKFKKTQKVQSTEFTDHALFNIIMESIVEGKLNLCFSALFCCPNNPYQARNCGPLEKS